MVKKVIYCIVIGTLLSGLLLGCAPAEAKVLRAVTAVPRDSETNVGFWKFVEWVNERSEGELTIEFVGGPEAIAAAEQGEAVRTGAVDIAVVYSSAYKAIVPQAVGGGLSQLTPAEEREVGYYDLLNKLHQEKGLYYLGRAASRTPECLFINVKIENPRTDFQGLKIRSGSAIKPFVEALGAARVSMPMTDMYAALDRGVVDGLFTQVIDAAEVSLYEVTEYVIPIYTAWGFVGIIVNLDVWNGLPKKLQDLLTETVIEEENWVADYYTQRYEAALKQFTDAGVEVIKFSAADEQWYIELALDTRWKEVLDADPVNGPVMRQMLTK